jgi:environmental stress-induced protein Ves
MTWHTRLVPKSAFNRMAWKNGQGTSWEIARGDRPSGVASWRLSIAEISADAEFSIFQNIERHLTVIEGNGIVLSSPLAGEKILNRFDSLRFAGEDPIRARSIAGPTRDLNLMVDRRDWSFSTSLEQEAGRFQADTDAAAFIAVCLAGEASYANGETIPVGSAVIAERDGICDEPLPAIEAQAGAIVFRASICPQGSA